MNVPSQYSYNPNLRLIVFLCGTGVAWFVVTGLVCGCRPHGFALWFGLAPVALGLGLLVRRLAFRCNLLLDTDALVLPTGFGRVRTMRIPYADIRDVWHARLVWMDVLMIATKGRKFEILSVMLPDTQSYIDVGEFLKLRTQRNQLPPD